MAHPGAHTGHHCRSGHFRFHQFSAFRPVATCVYAMRLFVDTDWRICLHHCLSRNSPKRDKPIPLSRCGCCFHRHHLLNALHDQGGSSFLQCHLSSYTRTHTRENKQQQKSLARRAALSPLAHADRLTSQRCQHLSGAQCGCRSDCIRFSAPLL